MKNIPNEEFVPDTDILLKGLNIYLRSFSYIKSKNIRNERWLNTNFELIRLV